MNYPRFGLRCLVFLFGMLFQVTLFSQETEQSPAFILSEARSIIDTLTSPEMAGRGYLRDGHTLAANWIEKRFRELGLQPLMYRETENGREPVYQQPFPLRINLVQNGLLAINGDTLEPGVNYIGYSASGSGAVQEAKVKDLGYGLKVAASVNGKVAMLRDGWPEKFSKKPEKKEKYADMAALRNRIDALLPLRPAGIVIVREKLTALYNRERLGVPILEVREDRLPKKPKRISMEVQSGIQSLTTQNVIGYIPGKEVPDTVILITGHYDHMGAFGDAYFPGANDNASGIAMMLSLARHFSEHPPRMSVVFIAFGGEEAGLLGSEFYVLRNPLVPLEQTKFVLNLDLMANGDEGMTAVAGQEFPAYFDLLAQLNDTLKAVPSLIPRPNRANSDHYYFVRKGVPGVFLFTMGGPPWYHDVFDKSSALNLSYFPQVRALLVAFTEEVMKP